MNVKPPWPAAGAHPRLSRHQDRRVCDRPCGDGRGTPNRTCPVVIGGIGIPACSGIGVIAGAAQMVRSRRLDQRQARRYGGVPSPTRRRQTFGPEQIEDRQAYGGSVLPRLRLREGTEHPCSPIDKPRLRLTCSQPRRTAIACAGFQAEKGDGLVPPKCLICRSTPRKTASSEPTSTPSSCFCRPGGTGF